MTGGCAWWGGMHGRVGMHRIRACMAGEHVWQGGGMCGRRDMCGGGMDGGGLVWQGGHVWHGGVHAWQGGAYMAGKGQLQLAVHILL